MKTPAHHLGSLRFFLCLLLFTLANAGSADAAAYIKFDGVDGEALSARHEGWSNLSTVTQVIEREIATDTGSTRTRGTAKFADLLCTKELDKSSPKLAEAVANGKVFPTVEIQLTRNGEGGQVAYLTYKLKNVMITSYNLFGQGNNISGTNHESLALNFEEITMTYTVFALDGSTDGNVEFMWKVEEGTN